MTERPAGGAELRGPVRYLWWLVTSQRWRVTAAAVLGTVWMLGLTLPPYVISLAVDRGLRRGDFGALAEWVLVLLVMGVANAWVAILRHRTLTRVRLDAALRTVEAVAGRAAALGASLDAGAGEVSTMGITDVWVIGSSLTAVGPGVGGAVAYLVVAGLLLAVSPLLALVVLLGAPVVAVLVGPLLGRMRTVGTGYRDLQGELAARLVDLVDGLRVLNGIGGKDLVAERYREGSRRLRAEGYRLSSTAAWMPTIGVGLPLLFLAAVTWLAARMAAAGTITAGQFVAVYGYVAVLVVPVTELIDSFSGISRAVVAARRVVALLRLGREAGPSGAAPADGAGLHDPASGVRIAAGRLTALAAASAADATAVVDRLGGLVPSEATWGGVRLDGVERRQLRERILVADNDAELFAGTLRAVVSGRRDPHDATVLAALRTAVAEDVAAGLPGGTAGAVAPQGRNLSGGQRQRLRLARALVADPEVLLAAEPTSALDAHTEATVAERLGRARAGRTTVVTSTSPPLLDRADVVHYLAGGRVAATGTHRELLEREPGYRRLVSRDPHDDPAPGAPRPGGPSAAPEAAR